MHFRVRTFIPLEQLKHAQKLCHLLFAQMAVTASLNMVQFHFQITTGSLYYLIISTEQSL